MWISVRRAWMGFFKPAESDKGMFHFYQFAKETSEIFLLIMRRLNYTAKKEKYS